MSDAGGKLPISYITERLDDGGYGRGTRAGPDVRRARRPDASGDPPPAGLGRGHGDRAGGAVRDDSAGRVEASEGARARGADRAGSRPSVAPGPPAGRAAARGGRV